MGGATWLPPGARNLEPSFNRRGDSLGGATRLRLEDLNQLTIVSIAEAILWGEQHNTHIIQILKTTVSIAEAILWGEQRHAASAPTPRVKEFQSQRRFFGGSNYEFLVSEKLRIHSFNRRGDSLGGATNTLSTSGLRGQVSIAEAILWGEQRSCLLVRRSIRHVSIAEAILWGEQPY